MPTSSEFRRLHRRAGIDRFAGLPPQFERVDRDWLFRRYGHGPAIRVSDDEYAAFMRNGVRAIVLHGVALVAFGALAWLLLERLLPGAGNASHAIVFGVALSLVAFALYGSLRHHADAPTRALAHRPPELPARDPDASMQPEYSTIVVLVLFLLFMAAIGTQQPAGFYIVFAVVAVMLGVFLAIRRQRFDRILTVVQRERVRDQRVAAREAERARRQQPEPLWKGALLLVFVAIELVLLFGGILLGVGIAQKIAGQTSADASFGVFILGFIPGLAFGGLLFWPLERLCKRWTGYSAVHAFDWIPPSW
ncbi:NAD(P)(+) transhydrogenase (Re/Si-specific) subunit beta [Sphingomonas ginsenosidivorax]|uniref:NAD(P)(+) transhydrogenase (Re/Si-specific) subunit beta n=1 Tax=Sphingomonas ginsenosidivorax TaxID=862135 RepID=A0A5C6UE71_9SPHN|nr:NAD(P)(+) transhydrogenase (Re/Si-specific) subunit beta [Sphingomonas ginsenosidivorax]TXC71053.1 NAD(P)(+) transhydrogenase (Re/Si-specific) subunit beta [Sphingomonas ginsenosidivorax]